MNERIRELAEQANIHFSRLGILDGDPNGMVRYLSYGKMEEFAQLIVRECIKCSDPLITHYIKTHTEPYQSHLLAAIADYSSEIRKHFGVEE